MFDLHQLAFFDRSLHPHNVDYEVPTIDNFAVSIPDPRLAALAKFASAKPVPVELFGLGQNDGYSFHDSPPLNVQRMNLEDVIDPSLLLPVQPASVPTCVDPRDLDYRNYAPPSSAGYTGALVPSGPTIFSFDTCPPSPAPSLSSSVHSSDSLSSSSLASFGEEGLDHPRLPHVYRSSSVPRLGLGLAAQTPAFNPFSWSHTHQSSTSSTTGAQATQSQAGPSRSGKRKPATRDAEDETSEASAASGRPSKRAKSEPVTPAKPKAPSKPRSKPKSKADPRPPSSSSRRKVKDPAAKTAAKKAFEAFIAECVARDPRPSPSIPQKVWELKFAFGWDRSPPIDFDIYEDLQSHPYLPDIHYSDFDDIIGLYRRPVLGGTECCLRHPVSGARCSTFVADKGDFMRHFHIHLKEHILLHRYGILEGIAFDDTDHRHDLRTLFRRCPEALNKSRHYLGVCPICKHTIARDEKLLKHIKRHYEPEEKLPTK
ncbi:hypothetical protein SISNIDRAFT_489833 [Sistotremastrum niveocremeum HHB9708]|uniref:C2H2-type domain-containing protein n=1 Tax=Sistotremastrum niveocremeum HHB9708 TaxID=1314777 RepID=A0A164PJV7_9AGAM|nr:hypothetical protein SISNIDRAFT_489833 [Sistotremastrum niveocremeum HHB9708]